MHIYFFSNIMMQNNGSEKKLISNKYMLWKDLMRCHVRHIHESHKDETKHFKNKCQAILQRPKKSDILCV